MEQNNRLTLSPFWVFLATFSAKSFAFSALTLLVGWQEGHSVCKNWVVGCWRGCLGWGADLHIPSRCHCHSISCSSKSRLVLTSWFYQSGTCSPGWSQTYTRRAVKRLCVCVFVNREAEYCDDHVCLCVLVNISRSRCPNFLCILPVAVSQSSGGVAICYIFQICERCHI